MKRYTKFGKLLILAGITTQMSLPSIAFSTVLDSENTLDLTKVQVTPSLNKDPFCTENIGTFLPTNMSPTTDQNAFRTQFQNGVQQRVADTMKQNILNSPNIKDFSDHLNHELDQMGKRLLGQSTDDSNAVASTAANTPTNSQPAATGAAASNNATGATPTTTVAVYAPAPHRENVKLDIKANERKAMLSYEGFLHMRTDLVYAADSNNVSLTFTRPLSNTATLTLRNSSSVGQINPAANLSFNYNF